MQSDAISRSLARSLLGRHRRQPSPALPCQGFSIPSRFTYLEASAGSLALAKRRNAHQRGEGRGKSLSLSLSQGKSKKAGALLCSSLFSSLSESESAQLSSLPLFSFFPLLLSRLGRSLALLLFLIRCRRCSRPAPRGIARSSSGTQPPMLPLRWESECVKWRKAKTRRERKKEEERGASIGR